MGVSFSCRLRCDAAARAVLAVLVAGGVSAPLRAQSTAQSAARRVIPSAFAAVSTPVGRELSGDRAHATVAFVEQFFRLPGNRGYDASIDTLAALLESPVMHGRSTT